MIDISNEVTARLDAIRIANVYSRKNALTLRLREAKSNLASEHLVSWQAEAAAFVALVEGQLRAAEKRIVNFEARVPELERAVAEHIQAIRDVESLSKLIAMQGTDDRAEALRRRDDLTFAEARVLHWSHVADQLTFGARSCLPTADRADVPPGKEIVDTIARHVTARKFGHNGAGISPQTFTRWLDSTDEETLAGFAWHIPEVIASAARERKATDRHDPRREEVTLPVADFLAELSNFRSARAAAIKAKVAQAAIGLEQAKARAAALGSAVAS